MAETKYVSLTTTDYKGERVQYDFPKILYYIVKEMENKARHELDAVALITGWVGGGKSNLGDGLAGTWEELNNTRYELEQNFFKVEDLVAYTDSWETVKKAVKFDEAIQGGTGRDTNTFLGNKLKVTLVTKRMKKHLWIFIVDNPKELSEKIIERANVLINVMWRFNDDNLKYEKGYFNIYNKTELTQIYDDLKKKKVRYIHEHSISKKKPTYRTLDYSNIWFKKSDYEKKKTNDTKQLMYRDEESEVLKQRDKAIYYALFLGAKQRELGNFLGLSRTAISDIKARMTTTQDPKS